MGATIRRNNHRKNLHRQRLAALIDGAGKRQGYPLRENTLLGLDIGIASCGWAMLDMEGQEIIGTGTWGFDPPEIAKTRASKAAERRGFRSQRRRLRRRRGRMRDIRALLYRHGLLASPDPAADIKGQAKPSLDPWQLRAEGLERKLTGEEFATCLLHIAKHRGYRSNSKSERGENAPPEDKKALAGLASIKEKSGRYKTVGQMFANDPEFETKKRNHAGEYSHTVLRELHEDEVGELFNRQRQLNSAFADQSMQETYAKTAFDQLPIQDSEKLLGTCPFEPDEKRASSLSYSFERFRFLAKLVHTRIHDGSKSGRPLTRDELSAAVNGFGRGAKKISWSKLKKQLGLDRDLRFIGVGDKDETKDVARNSKGCAFGSNILHGVIGDTAWTSLVPTPEILDGIAHVLTFREDVDRIRKGLSELELEPALLNALMTGVRDGAFAGFSKAGHISTKAARKIIPGLLAGKVYSDACAAVEPIPYDHSKERPVDLDAITNPVAKRAIRETLKQVNALVRHFGFRPGAIHVELGRDVGKGPDERGKIEAGIKRRTGEKDAARKEFCDMVGIEEANCKTHLLQRYELWKEQLGNCMFCAGERRIDVRDLLDGKHKVEIEHILPRGRSHDNSWHNKVLSCVKCNRDKTNKTPWEWFGKEDLERWHEFELRVRELRANRKIKGFKIRNLLMRDFEERKGEFLNRNLNDTRYAARVVLGELRYLYSKEERKHMLDGRERPQMAEGEPKEKLRVLARPGAVTAALRHSWGLNRYKFLRDAYGNYIHSKDGKKERLEDERHHGVDAIVLAACDEPTLQKLTRALQQKEKIGLPALEASVKDFPPPWPSFADDVKAAYASAPVARTENRRARGAGHAATIRQIRMEEDHRIVYERVAIDKITKAALDRVKDPERNQDVIDALSNWIVAGKPVGDLPKRINGFPIKKVTLRSETKPTTERAGFEAHNGLVDNAAMVRVDVFVREQKFYLVPIYAHQVASKEGWLAPPNLAVVSAKPEKNWQLVDESFVFRFSLYPYSWVEAVKRNGEVVEGYYRGTDRATGAITLSRETSKQRLIRGVGVRTLHALKKFQVDRLGGKHEISRETRTWRGEACT